MREVETPGGYRCPRNLLESSPMKPSTVRLHAYLFVASISAILIQLAVIVSIVLLHVPERAFETVAFRVAVVVAVVVATGGAMLVVRRLARRAAQDDETRNRTQAQVRAARAVMHAVREPLRARHRRNAALAETARAGER
jgi:Na+/melibiose symporter-like transporter